EGREPSGRRDRAFELDRRGVVTAVEVVDLFANRILVRPVHPHAVETLHDDFAPQELPEPMPLLQVESEEADDALTAHQPLQRGGEPALSRTVVRRAGRSETRRPHRVEEV